MRKKVFLIIFCLFFASRIFAYSPSSDVLNRAKTTSERINTYISRIKNTTKSSVIKKAFLTQLPIIQTQFMVRGEIDKMYLTEYIRRHIIGNHTIEKNDIIDDDDIGYTWTHAPHGFDIFYFERPVPSFGSIDMQGYSTLINGSYFSKMEGGIYPSGFLYFGGQIYTEFLTDDKQITHMYCEKNGRIDIWENARYVSEEDITQKCDTAFQVGPLIYSSHDGHTSENLAQKTYIGSAHSRTIMVIFESAKGTQDMWFLTAYRDKTFTQIRDIVLSETRFYGTYKNIDILNLDGGSSVAYRSKNFPELNFGKSKQLPIVFAIK